MALNGLGVGTTNELNFGNKGMLNSGIDLQGNTGRIKSLKETSKEKLDAFEKLTIRLSILAIIFVMIYGIIGKNLMNDMSAKIVDTETKIAQTNKSIDTMAKNRNSIEDLSSEYKSMISRLNNESVSDEEAAFRERELPNFLQRLATTIPTEVKLVSIENTEDRHFVIQAKALKYQQLGIFQAILKQNNILSDVSGSTGIRYHDEEANQDYILVTIEGDLI
jgi:cell division protein FtsL